MQIVKASFTHKKRRSDYYEFYHLTVFHNDRLYRVYTDFLEFMVIEFQEESEERITKKEKKDIEYFIESKRESILEKKDLSFSYIKYDYQKVPVKVKRINVKGIYTKKEKREEITYS